MDAYRSHFIFVFSFPQRYTFIDTLLHRLHSEIATLYKPIPKTYCKQLDIVRSNEYNISSD